MTPNHVRTLLTAAALWIAASAAGLHAAPKPLPPAYSVALTEAFDCFHKRDFGGALRYLDEADHVVQDTPAVLNARGAIAIERRDFDQGAKYCLAALEKDPQFILARFNLGEIPFMQKHYAEARSLYEEVQAVQPGNELVQYRIFLCYLLEKNEAAAQEALDRVKFPGDTAAHYYANAAWEFAHDRPEKAQEWLDAGDNIFNKAKNVYLADPLVDLGWLKRKKYSKSGAE
jgi:tetratricopeptide (TPR) repeat protein